MAAYRGFMTHVTCRLTAKKRDQPRNPTLGNRVRATFTFFTESKVQQKLYSHFDLKIDKKQNMREQPI